MLRTAGAAEFNSAKAYLMPRNGNQNRWEAPRFDRGEAHFFPARRAQNSPRTSRRASFRRATSPTSKTPSEWPPSTHPNSQIASPQKRCVAKLAPVIFATHRYFITYDFLTPRVSQHPSLRLHLHLKDSHTEARRHRGKSNQISASPSPLCAFVPLCENA